MGQHISRDTEQAATFPTRLAEELIEWVYQLPAHLGLPAMSGQIRRFDRDVFKLHLPYLTTITLLHLNWTSSQRRSQRLPEPYTAAVLSASCVARVFKELLARREIRFLGAIACWYVGVAIVALLHTQCIERLAESGAADLRILRLTLKELASEWPSTAIFVKGFERMHVFDNLGVDARPDDMADAHGQQATDIDGNPQADLADLDRSYGIDYQRFFPFVGAQSTGLAGLLIAEHETDLWADVAWLGDPASHLQGLFDFSDTFIDPCIDILSSCEG